MKMNFNTKKLIIVGASLTTISILINGCSTKIEEPTLTDESIENTTSSEAMIESSQSETSEVPSETTDNYTFDWNDTSVEAFCEYFNGQFGDFTLAGYIGTFGYTNELNQVLTDFINMYFNRNYESVPFSRVKYFRTVIADKDNDLGVYEDYDAFYPAFLNPSNAMGDSFRNKLVISYLIQNNIPFGDTVPIENLKALVGDDVYSLGAYDHIRENRQLGSYSEDYQYSNKDLCSLLILYNNKIFNIKNDQREFEYSISDSMEKFGKYADNISQFYSEEYGVENFLIFGEVPNEDKYRSVFGEEPLDLSYIPGAVVKDSEVKGSAKARYNDDLYNYNVSYIPGYEYYTEETESTRSR